MSTRGRKKILTDEERKQHKREAQARWRAKNHDYYTGYRRLWRSLPENKAKEKATHDKWVAENRDHVNEYQRNYKKKQRMQKCIEQLAKENII